MLRNYYRPRTKSTPGEGGVPTFDGGGGGGGSTYLPSKGATPIPGQEGTYPGQGVGYLPWAGYAVGGTPLAASRRRTFLFEVLLH